MHAIPGKIIVALLAGFLLASLAKAQTPIPVKVQPLSEVLIAVQYSAPADVRSLNTATVSAEVTAVVKQVLIDVGQEIKSGQPMLELNASDYQLTLNQARANLASSKAQKAQADARLTRARELGAKQYLSADELLARETDVMVVAAQIQVQEALVALAQRNLEKCQIDAPFDGVVVERFAQLGSYVSQGSPLFQLVQTDRFELNAEIPDEMAQNLEQATSLQFVSRNESWPVRLLRLSPVVDAERRSRQARFKFTASTPAIGRSGELSWQVGQALLPVNLVVRRNGKLGVFLNQSNTAVFSPLPDAQEGRPAAIGLPLDVEVIVQGRERLQDGDSITPSR